MLEHSALHCEMGNIGIRNSTEQTTTERIPLKDISMGEQLNKSCFINDMGRKDKRNWKCRARTVGMEKTFNAHQVRGDIEITEKKNFGYGCRMTDYGAE